MGCSKEWRHTEWWQSDVTYVYMQGRFHLSDARAHYLGTRGRCMLGAPRSLLHTADHRTSVLQTDAVAPARHHRTWRHTPATTAKRAIRNPLQRKYTLVTQKIDHKKRTANFETSTWGYGVVGRVMHRWCTILFTFNAFENQTNYFENLNTCEMT